MAKKNHYSASIVFHPGETLSEKLEEMKMGPKEFALRCNKPEKTIIAVLQGKSALTPDMAVLFEKATRIPAHFWMNLQKSYDEFIAREQHQMVIKESVAWAQQFPLADMIKKGWLSPVTTLQEKTMALLTFFGFAHPTAWEKYYLNQQLKVAFRISLAETHQPYALSAWLRKGALQANELVENEYSEKKFKDALPQFKAIMATQPKGFFLQLQRICVEAGVKVVYTPSLPKTTINGCTRWLNNTPFIQLTDRYKRNDFFWFTFFHAVGHILLHGKKDIFLENIEYADKELHKEQEANEFAYKWLLSKDEELEILDVTTLSKEKIKKFAKKFNTHPSIIIGRLHDKKSVSATLRNHYFEPITLDK